jgi:hypothetical protein
MIAAPQEMRRLIDHYIQYMSMVLNILNLFARKISAYIFHFNGKRPSNYLKTKKIEKIRTLGSVH